MAYIQLWGQLWTCFTPTDTLYNSRVAIIHVMTLANARAKITILTRLISSS